MDALEFVESLSDELCREIVKELIELYDYFEDENQHFVAAFLWMILHRRRSQAIAAEELLEQSCKADACGKIEWKQELINKRNKLYCDEPHQEPDLDFFM